ncbi:glycosyltransferase family 4 protein [Pseudotamlana carrageenivorans]|uniref:Glycosyl transferase family 1 domain-containing protein n=1 Tax=Pseudotamlana carrageenivorans TaxID=2069432 RepID=A0A2I7SDZ8_9FLAO|nr:glycosyltransferase family 4 protein [Tamlana carrageenivorans]AUS04132.1 hypothetical protein C1A40_00940 [Tamlana carrageenivorans]
MSFRFKNKKIIFLLNSPDLGGAERQALALAGYLQNSLGCDIFIYTCIKREPSFPFEDFLKEQKLMRIELVKNPLVASKYFKYFKIRFKLLCFALKLKKHNPDLIIPYLNKPSLITGYCKKIIGTKLSFWNNRGHEIYRNDILEKKAVLHSDFFLVNSLDSISDVLTNFKISKENVYFLPNFLTVSNKIVDFPRNKNDLVVGMLAHFRKGKLQELLLETFVELSKKYKFIKLHLVGNDFDEKKTASLKLSVQINGLIEKVSFIHGASGENEIPKFDIAILVSEKEGMSNSVMEYMYFEKPIIASNHYGNEFLLGEHNQFLINNSKAELFEKIECLILDEQLRKSAGQKNKKRILENFSVVKYVSELENIINKYI